MSRSYHRIIVVGLVLLNLLCVLLAIWAGEPGRRDWHFRDGSLLTTLSSAEMLGAALLFVTCFFAENIVPRLGERERKPHAWLVFALGFFMLALDQQLGLREALTVMIDGAPLQNGEPSTTHLALKVVTIVLGAVLVFYFRAAVLANVRMVLAMIAGFWFLLLMLLFDMLFESIGVAASTVIVMEGAAKLVALSMFLSAAFIAVLDRIAEARALGARLEILEDGQRRRAAVEQRHEQALREAAAAAAADAETDVATAAAEGEEPAAEQEEQQEERQEEQQEERQEEQQEEQEEEQEEGEAPEGEAQEGEAQERPASE